MDFRTLGEQSPKTLKEFCISRSQAGVSSLTQSDSLSLHLRYGWSDTKFEK